MSCQPLPNPKFLSLFPKLKVTARQKKNLHDHTFSAVFGPSEASELEQLKLKFDFDFQLAVLEFR